MLLTSGVIQVKDITVQQSARVAPLRPRFSSEGSDEEENGGEFGKQPSFVINMPPKVQASDGVVSTDTESDAPTAEQINAEVSERAQQMTTEPNLAEKAANPSSKPQASNRR